MAVEKSTTAVQPFVTSESPSMENFNLRIEQANAALAGKQGKLTGTAGQIVGFNTNGEPVAQENTATKLKTPRKIGDANFDGSADITLAQMGVDAAISAAIANIDPGTGSGGNADTATKLATARAIDGVNFDGSAAITHYSTCSTAAATAAKVVALTGFTLVTGARIAVKFTVTNTAASPTLNVNSTGAKAIYYRGAAVSTGQLVSGRIYEFIYNGTQYEVVSGIDTNSNQNILLNADFRAPVNRLGESEYSSDVTLVPCITMFSIVRAELKIEDGFINFKTKSVAAYKRIIQFLPTTTTLKAGETYTLSVLGNFKTLSGSVWLRFTKRLAGLTGAPAKSLAGLQGINLVSYTLTLPSDASGAEILVDTAASDFCDIDIYGMKAEPGTQQTLAHKDADGNWVFNAPVNYA